jgi:molecular chaperone DnaK (HSP70)
MSEIVGINLGTANSSISVFKDGKAMVIPNNEGYIRIPSVVSLNDNDIIVGSLAKRQLLIHPENTHSLLNYYLNQGFNIKDLLIKNLIANASSYLNKAIHEIVLSLPCIDMNNDYKDVCNELSIKINKITRSHRKEICG